MTSQGIIRREPADVEPVNSDDEPSYVRRYASIVRTHRGRNVLRGVDRETNVHGAQAGCRVIVSSSYLSGRGTITEVRDAAPIDGGAILMVRLDGDDQATPVRAVACMLP